MWQAYIHINNLLQLIQSGNFTIRAVSLHISDTVYLISIQQLWTTSWTSLQFTCDTWKKVHRSRASIFLSGLPDCHGGHLVAASDTSEWKSSMTVISNPYSISCVWWQCSPGGGVRRSAWLSCSLKCLHESNFRLRVTVCRKCEIIICSCRVVARVSQQLKHPSQSPTVENRYWKEASALGTVSLDE